jgi:hypothetical protein
MALPASRGDARRTTPWREGSRSREGDEEERVKRRGEEAWRKWWEA